MLDQLIAWGRALKTPGRSRQLNPQREEGCQGRCEEPLGGGHVLRDSLLVRC